MPSFNSDAAIRLHEVIPTGIRGISQNRGKYEASATLPPETACFHRNSLSYTGKA